MNVEVYYTNQESKRVISNLLHETIFWMFVFKITLSFVLSKEESSKQKSNKKKRLCKSRTFCL